MTNPSPLRPEAAVPSELDALFLDMESAIKAGDIRLRWHEVQVDQGTLEDCRAELAALRETVRDLATIAIEGVALLAGRPQNPVLEGWLNDSRATLRKHSAYSIVLESRKALGGDDA